MLDAKLACARMKFHSTNHLVELHSSASLREHCMSLF